jgi:HK97 gp10 family phage protein
MIRYKSNLQNVLNALEQAEDRALTAVGEFGRSASQMASPVKTGNLRDSNDYKVELANKRVLIGNSVEYGLWVHEGTSRQRAQPWIERSIMGNVNRIQNLVSEMMRI